MDSDNSTDTRFLSASTRIPRTAKYSLASHPNAGDACQASKTVPDLTCTYPGRYQMLAPGFNQRQVEPDETHVVAAICGEFVYQQR